MLQIASLATTLLVSTWQLGHVSSKSQFIPTMEGMGFPLRWEFHHVFGGLQPWTITNTLSQHVLPPQLVSQTINAFWIVSWPPLLLWHWPLGLTWEAISAISSSMAFFVAFCCLHLYLDLLNVSPRNLTEIVVYLDLGWRTRGSLSNESSLEMTCCLWIFIFKAPWISAISVTLREGYNKRTLHNCVRITFNYERNSGVGPQ